MANGTDPYLDSLDRISKGGSGTAVAEPEEEEDPYLASLKKAGQPPEAPHEVTPNFKLQPFAPVPSGGTPPTTAGAQVGKSMLPMTPPAGLKGIPPQQLVETQRQTEQQSPYLTSGITGTQAKPPLKMTRGIFGQPMIDDRPQSPGNAHMVRGMFGMPDYSQPIRDFLSGKSSKEDFDAQIMREGAATPDTRLPQEAPEDVTPQQIAKGEQERRAQKEGPLASLSKAESIGAPKDIQDRLSYVQSKMRDATFPERYDENGKKLPNFADYSIGPGALVSMAIGVPRMAKGLINLYGPESFSPEEVGLAADEAPVKTTAGGRLSQQISGFNDAVGGAFQTIGPLAMASPEAIASLPVYATAASAGQAALTKVGVRPDIAEAATNIALMVGGALHASVSGKQVVDADRQFVIESALDAAMDVREKYPNLEKMPQEQQAAIWQDATNKVWAKAVNSKKIQSAALAKTLGINPEDLYAFVNQEQTTAKALPAAEGGASGPEPSPTPQTPPEAPTEPQEAAPPKPVRRPARKAAPPAAPAEEEGLPMEAPESVSPVESARDEAEEGPEGPPPGVAERRATPRMTGGPTALRTARLSELRSSLRDPELSDRDREIMQSQYDDMIAHPEETGYEGPGFGQIKGANQQTVSREEAEANVEKRKGGRNARFGEDQTPAEQPAPTELPTGPPSDYLIGKEEKAPQAEGIAHYYNEDEGTESTVTRTPQGFAVNVRDTESGNDLGVVRIFKDQTSALNHAQQLVNRFENIPATPQEKSSKPTIEFSNRPPNSLWNDKTKSWEPRPAKERAKPLPPAETVYSPSVIEQAKQEVEGAHGMWAAFERPGVYRTDYETGLGSNEGRVSIKAADRKPRFYGVGSQRSGLEQQIPWLRNVPDTTEGKMREAIAKGKGAEYNRLLHAAASFIAKERETSAPILEEYAARLEGLAGHLRETDPDLANTLMDLANGNSLRGIRNLREYVEGKIADANAAIAFGNAIDAAAEEASEAGGIEPGADEETGAEESTENAGELRGEEGVLPGLEEPLAEQRAGAARVQGERLGEEFNRPAGSIDEIAGKMESRSPLFQGTGASPQEDLFEERKTSLEGPGTPSVEQGKDSPKSGLDELTDAVKNAAKPSEKLTDRLKKALDISHEVARARDAVGGALENVKAGAAAISDLLTRPPDWTNFKDALGEYQAGVQKSAFEIRNFTKQLKRSIPNVDTRNAMAAFIEADGDQKKLSDWSAKSKGDAKKVYDDALKLTHEERTVARNIQQFQDERGQIAVDQGIMEHMIENYVMHVWKKDNAFTRGVVNLARTRMLQRNPSFAKQRVFPTVFEGEQAGYQPETRDLGTLTAAHEHAQNEAILARAFIRSMLDGKEKDGRPSASVSGSGSAIPESQINKNAYFIKADTKPEDIADYRRIDHPALREWKWATKDSDGNPIFVRGDIVVHPDVYRKLKNVLTRSAISSYTIPGTDIQPGRTLLNLGSEFKNTLLSLSGFHQTQEAVHALEHRVNPSRLVNLDFNDKEQYQLIKHGLQVVSYDGQEAFSEGLSASGLINKLPGIGPLMQRYQDYLFQDYIPRLKMTMALEALRRNRSRYPELSKDQVYEITGNQANAAFGEQNYTMMGRNKTFQDVLRLGLLAPDFFESRARFAGQAAKPYGREQLIALMLGAAVLYVGARVMNKLLDDDPHWDAQDAFSIVHNGKSYMLRTIQGDIAHLMTDPRGFVYNRLNPMTARTAIEAITGRDKYGRKRSAADQAKDLIGELVPIPAQGQLKSIPETPGETLLTSAGVTTYPYKTPAENLAQQYAMDAIGSGDDRSPSQIKASRRAAQLVNNIRTGKQTQKDLQEALDKKEISASQFSSATKQLSQSSLSADTERLGTKQLLDVFDVASKGEREQLVPKLRSKVTSVEDLDADTRKEIEPRLESALRATGNDAFIPGPVDDELARLHYQGLRTPDTLAKSIKYDGMNLPLAPKEQAEYQELRGTTARNALAKMIEDSDYKALSDENKLDEVRGMIRDADAYANEQMVQRLRERRLGNQEKPASLPMEAPGAF